MLSTAYFSPNLAPGETFAGYPRTFISLGGAKTFVEEVGELTEKVERNGVDAAVDVRLGGIILVADLCFYSCLLSPTPCTTLQLFPSAVAEWVESLPGVQNYFFAHEFPRELLADRLDQLLYIPSEIATKRSLGDFLPPRFSPCLATTTTTKPKVLRTSTIHLKVFSPSI